MGWNAQSFQWNVGVAVLLLIEKDKGQENCLGQDKTANDPKHLNIRNASSKTSYALIASKYVVWKSILLWG